MKRLVSLVCLFLGLAVSNAAAETVPLLAQQPALSATQIVFVFAGDLSSSPSAASSLSVLRVAPVLPTMVGSWRPGMAFAISPTTSVRQPGWTAMDTEMHDAPATD